MSRRLVCASYGVPCHATPCHAILYCSLDETWQIMHQTIVDIPPTKRAASAPRGTVKIPATKAPLSMHSFMHMHIYPCTHTLSTHLFIHLALRRRSTSGPQGWRSRGRTRGAWTRRCPAVTPSARTLLFTPPLTSAVHAAAVPVGERA